MSYEDENDDPSQEQQLESDTGWQCASCGEWNNSFVDASAGRRQSYVEDCQICCKPNLLSIEYDLELGHYLIHAELE
jgi:hypothetical protein